jgi:hypothetical protein
MTILWSIVFLMAIGGLVADHLIPFYHPYCPFPKTDGCSVCGHGPKHRFHFNRRR